MGFVGSIHDAWATSAPGVATQCRLIVGTSIG
jgi:hypothetical protein